MTECCPRCHEVIHPGAIWTRLASAAGRRSVWQVRHRRGGGVVCTAYVGDRLRAADPQPVPVVGGDYRAPILDFARELARRAG
jgi:hypothetical protein